MPEEGDPRGILVFGAGVVGLTYGWQLAHAHDEMRRAYAVLVETGTRLNVSTPKLLSFTPYIERL